MNRNLGMFLVFIALILLSVLVVNGLYFNTPAVKTAEREAAEEVEKDYITTNLSINQQREYDPEIVEVVLGFENESREQAAAVEENNKIVSELMSILEAEELENIETQAFRVYPYTRYEKINDEDEDQERVTYYRVSNQLKFTSKNLGELPVLLAELLNAGANRVVNIDYRLENNEKALEEVTASALSSLKDKAAFMAENLDKENYRIVQLNFGRQNLYGSDSLQSMSRSLESSNIKEVPLAEQKVNINVSVSAEVELY